MATLNQVVRTNLLGGNQLPHPLAEHELTVQLIAQQQIVFQIHLARRVPGKTEFNEMLRFFMRQIEREWRALRGNGAAAPA